MLCVLCTFCCRGNLYSVLTAAAEAGPGHAALTWAQLMRFAWDAGKGMLYLHTLQPPVIHR